MDQGEADFLCGNSLNHYKKKAQNVVFVRGYRQGEIGQ